MIFESGIAARTICTMFCLDDGDRVEILVDL